MRKPGIALALLSALLAALFSAAVARAEGVVFLVRHAEKSLEVEGDSAPLLKAGVDRARTLARMLADAGIAELITTDALRSRQTGAPFAERTGLQPQVMTRDEQVAFAARLRERPDGKDRLIVGHTRTIPRILEALGVPGGSQVKLNAEVDYDHLFVVQTYPNRAPSMVRLRFEVADQD